MLTGTVCACRASSEPAFRTTETKLRAAHRCEPEQTVCALHPMYWRSDGGGIAPLKYLVPKLLPRNVRIALQTTGDIAGYPESRMPR